MTQIILIGVAVVLGVVLYLLIVSRKEAEKHGTSIFEEVVGMCAVAFEKKAEKEIKKRKIIALLKAREELSNIEIRKELHFPRNSVVRYMDELEKEKKVAQVGVTGRGVVYKLL